MKYTFSIDLSNLFFEKRYFRISVQNSIFALVEGSRNRHCIRFLFHLFLHFVLGQCFDLATVPGWTIYSRHRVHLPVFACQVTCSPFDVPIPVSVVFILPFGRGAGISYCRSTQTMAGPSPYQYRAIQINRLVDVNQLHKSIDGMMCSSAHRSTKLSAPMRQTLTRANTV